jgi:hypothetical protein
MSPWKPIFQRARDAWIHLNITSFLIFQMFQAEQATTSMKHGPAKVSVLPKISPKVSGQILVNVPTKPTLSSKNAIEEQMISRF